MNVLFVCSKNEWRSRTAETIFRNNQSFECKSAGTSKTARISVNAKHVNWADVIFVMENHHKKRLQQMFGEILKEKEMIVLDIPDEYEYMNSDLIDELEDAVESYLDV